MEKYIFYNSKLETGNKREILDYDNAGWILGLVAAFQENSNFKLSVSFTIFAPKINPFSQPVKAEIFLCFYSAIGRNPKTKNNKSFHKLKTVLSFW